MWVWECPAQPGVKNESHTKDLAEHFLRNHVTGVFVFGLKACKLEHEGIVDDGIPCRFGKKFCSMPYIRKNPYEQLSLWNGRRI